MIQDIRPPQRVRPAVPERPVLTPVSIPLPAKSPRFTLHPGALAAGGATGLALVVGVLGSGVINFDSASEASRRSNRSPQANVQSERKAHTMRTHWNWKRLTPVETETPSPQTVPGVADPVESIPEIIASLPVELPVPTAVPSPILAVSMADLTDPAKKDLAMQLVSSAENSSLNWRAQYGYIEDIGDGRGYTGGIIGFTSGTHDMLELVKYYASVTPGNVLAKYIPALERVDGSASHAGLGDAFVADWKTAAATDAFKAAQDHERDRVYFNPAVNQAKDDGLHTLGQFIYYDAMVMHGPGNDADSFGGIRAQALRTAKSPAQGGSETAYLNAFLDARVAAMKREAAHDDTSRVDTAQRLFLQAGNLYLNAPLSWKTYGDSFTIGL